MPFFNSPSRLNDDDDDDDDATAIMNLPASSATTLPPPNHRNHNSSKTTFDSWHLVSHADVLHPLRHIPHIIAKVLRFLYFAEVKNCRLVCKDWYETVVRSAAIRQLDLSLEVTRELVEPKALMLKWMRGDIVNLRNVKHLTVKNSRYVNRDTLRIGLGIVNDYGVEISSLSPRGSHTTATVLTPPNLSHKLVHVDLTGCYNLMDEAVLDLIRACASSLRCLILDRCDALFGKFIHKREFRELRLHEFSISRCFTVGTFPAHMLPVSLHIFRASRLGLIDHTFFKQLIEHLPDLQSLDVSFCSRVFPSGSSLAIMSDSERLPSAINLEAANFSHCFFASLYDRRRADMLQFPNLTRLILRNAPDVHRLMRGLLNFVSSGTSCKLQFLDLSCPETRGKNGTFVLEQSCREVFVSCLKSLSSLRVLTLLSWNLNSNLLYIITKSSICPSLQSLYLGRVEEARSFSTLFESDSLKKIYIESLTESEMSQCREMARFSRNSLVTVRVDPSPLEYVDVFNALDYPFESFPFHGLLVCVGRIIKDSPEISSVETSSIRGSNPPQWSMRYANRNATPSEGSKPSASRRKQKGCLIS